METKHAIIFDPFVWEEWKPFVYDKVTPNMYEISNLGRARNKNGQILKDCIVNSGYYVYRFYKDKPYRFTDKNRYKTVTVHRATLTTFCPIDNPDEMTVNHKDGDHTNNMITNLEWMTQAENNKHSFYTGLNRNIGENNVGAKFTNAQVVKICELLQEGGYSYRQILDIIGFENSDNARDMVGNVKRRKAWRQISKDYIW